MAMARGGCTDERRRVRERWKFVLELEDTEMPYITFFQMFQVGLLLKLDKQAAFKNHLHFHHVLIRTNMLYLFGK